MWWDSISISRKIKDDNVCVLSSETAELQKDWDKRVRHQGKSGCALTLPLPLHSLIWGPYTTLRAPLWRWGGRHLSHHQAVVRRQAELHQDASVSPLPTTLTTRASFSKQFSIRIDNYQRPRSPDIDQDLSINLTDWLTYWLLSVLILIMWMCNDVVKISLITRW